MSRSAKAQQNSPVPRVPENKLASSDAEAQNRAEQWKSKDPYPRIEPALLNSADILAYVKATSLIYPFQEDRLKGASYDVTIEGDVVYYENESQKPDKKKIIKLDKEGDYFDLPPNAIAFVTLQPIFRIPYYLALRFNLKITHIYKGLLLGTGPLVDPGFVGRLSIPLHNLTNNVYRFYKGDELITMEFTKMSTFKTWNQAAVNIGHNEQYIPNKIEPDRTVLEYISKALGKDGLNTVISSIPAAMMTSQQAAEEAKKEADLAAKSARVQAVVSIIAVCTLVFTAITLSMNAVSKAHERYDRLIEQYSAMEKEYSARIDELLTKITVLEEGLENSDNGNVEPGTTGVVGTPENHNE